MRTTVVRLVHAARAAYVTLGLTVSGVVALTVALVGLAGAMIAFGGATEDVTQHNGVVRSDPAHLRFFIDHRSHALDQVARVVTNSGMIAVLVVVAVVAAALFWYRGLRLGLAMAPVVSLAAAAIAAAATKSLVGRTRPPVSLHLVTENDASFPSGHATNSAAVFLTIGFVAAMYALRGPIVRTATVLAAALLSGMVGISRLVLGVHWPSDVLAGWALGLSAALTVTITLSLLARLRRTRPRDADPLLVRTARRAVDVLTIQRQARQSTLEAA